MAGYTPRQMMGAYYDKMNGRNKKRVDVLRLDGSLLKRCYDYGEADYLKAFYSGIFTADFFRVEVYEIGAKKAI